MVDLKPTIEGNSYKKGSVLLAKQQVVSDWLLKYENPMKPVVERIRELILEADSRIDECIKWQAPTFTYKGNLASFFPKSKKLASLMFHEGASIPGEHPILQGDAKAGRSIKLGSLEEVEANQDAIKAVVIAWCDWKDQEG